jgi:hypothetical protein
VIIDEQWYVVELLLARKRRKNIMLNCREMKKWQIYFCKDCGLELQVIEECKECGTDEKSCLLDVCKFVCCDEELALKE